MAGGMGEGLSEAGQLWRQVWRYPRGRAAWPWESHPLALGRGGVDTLSDKDSEGILEQQGFQNKTHRREELRGCREFMGGASLGGRDFR